jgi:hypothetical protein
LFAHWQGTDIADQRHADQQSSNPELMVKKNDGFSLGSLRPGGNFEIPLALPPAGPRYCDRN